MKYRTAVLQESALVVLVASAIEVFPKETYGLLIGKKQKYKAIIKNALPYQRAIRKVSEVSICQTWEVKALHVLNELCGYNFLGDFHSHIEYPDHLSKHDKKCMIEEGETMALLLLISESEKRYPWYYDKKHKSLHGTIKDTYEITVKVYAREPGKKVLRKLKIDCPYLKRLNKMNGKALLKKRRKQVRKNKGKKR